MNGKRFILTVAGLAVASLAAVGLAMNTRAAKAKRILNRTRTALYTAGKVMCVASGMEEA